MTTRLLELDDASELAEVWRRHRDFLAPWGPLRDDDFFTEEGQLESVGQRLTSFVEGHSVPLLVLEGERIVGELTLSSIIRGAFQSASVGYWLAEDAQGRGHATRAVRDAQRLAFGELGLHRLQAEVMPRNERSLVLLERTGFVPYGRAPEYLRIAGRWEEHLLLQCIAPDAGAV